MNVLILGSGGREQAIAWKVSQSPLVEKTFIAPGNAGHFPGCENISVSLSDFDAVADLIRKYAIRLVIVGPEVPLVEGITDFLSSAEGCEGVHIIGPSRCGAQLEGSKDFAKAFMARHHIPTAKYRTFTADEISEAKRYLREEEHAPYVLKADGLAAGKGVLIIEDLEEACREVESILSGKFGGAGRRVVIETFLSGIECSLFLLTDGHDYLLLPFAKDYKRIGEGDTGLNTGGMGAVSPVPFVDEAFLHKVEERIVKPTIQGLSQEQIDYKGFVFIGLINCNGEPYVIEYNCRMGDPETEVVMKRLSNDLVPILMSLDEGTLSQQKIEVTPGYTVTVVAVSGGYPGSYTSGLPMTLPEAEKIESVIFHAGTSRGDKGELVTAGGRVLAVSSTAETIDQAVEKSYQTLSLVSYDGIYYRKDIGKDLLKYQDA